MKNVSELIKNQKLEEAANVLYDTVLGILNRLSPKMTLSRAEWDLVAPYLVAKMEDPTKGTSTETTPEPGDDIEIKDTTAVLTIKLVGPEDDTEFSAPEEIKKNILVGATYKITPPTVVGYTPDKLVLEGVLTPDGSTVTVNYTKDPVKATLKITYVGTSGDADFVAPADVEQEVVVGEEYSVASPAVTGYTPDKATVSGTMTEDGVTTTVTYSKTE